MEIKARLPEEFSKKGFEEYKKKRKKEERMRADESAETIASRTAVIRSSNTEHV